MIFDNLIKAIVEGNIEQLLIYFPIFIIGVGLLVLLVISIKDSLKNVSGFLPSFRDISPPSFKFKKPSFRFIRPKKKRVEERVEKEVDYKKEIDKVLKEKSSIKAMESLSILINQFFSHLLGLHYAFTYEEVIKKLEAGGKKGLKEFCEKLQQAHFSKDAVSREEVENIAYEFLDITKKYGPKGEQLTKKAVKKSKLLIQLKRFKKELQREWGKGKNIEEKLDKVVGKTGETVWDGVKGYFLPTKTPRTVSFNAVLKDIKKHERKKGLATIFEEDYPTVEGFFYFVYLVLRKRIMENKKLNKIKGFIKEGQDILSTKMDVIQAQGVYTTLIPLYNSLSTENQKRILPKIVLFYEDINNCMKLQKAAMYLFHLELALKSHDGEKAKYFYSEVSKLYEQIPSQYKNKIYELFLNLEKKLNMNVPENKGGNKNA